MLAHTLTRPAVDPVFVRSLQAKIPEVTDSLGSGGPCRSCRLRTTCVPTGLSDAEFDQFTGLITTHRRVKTGQAIYRAGDVFKGIYLVRSGFSEEASGRYLALFFQLRRAFYFILRSLAGECESMRKLRTKIDAT